MNKRGGSRSVSSIQPYLRVGAYRRVTRCTARTCLAIVGRVGLRSLSVCGARAAWCCRDPRTDECDAKVMRKYSSMSARRGLLPRFSTSSLATRRAHEESEAMSHAHVARKAADALRRRAARMISRCPTHSLRISTRPRTSPSQRPPPSRRWPPSQLDGASDTKLPARQIE